MKKDVNELKKMFFEILQNPGMAQNIPMYNNNNNMDSMVPDLKPTISSNNFGQTAQPVFINQKGEDIHHHEAVEESLSIMDKKKKLIIKALKKHKGKRKDASSDLGISERTLYRKLKEYDIED
jgi:DNA-binding NtrC family response regulator